MSTESRFIFVSCSNVLEIKQYTLFLWLNENQENHEG